jgi:hypothetical protein
MALGPPDFFGLAGLPSRPHYGNKIWLKLIIGYPYVRLSARRAKLSPHKKAHLVSAVIHALTCLLP